MVTTLEVVLLLLVLAFFVGATRIIRTVKPFVVNAVVGLLTLYLAGALFGVSVAVTPVALVIVAVAGLPGALLVILLAVFGIGFVP
ncbi:pro-sigmaK processing inhibitor BofA family protein [Natronobiforma cellulositropha]|uniref:pro-sigmaK processing inhibitor BofA family protein n=1 Tax=Natronobiforma cellulositropha TaxID=1679076 RepID=UPI0021D56A19|nr:pro-sigmaK processing inhibitor BofA family protein [Natronobiforma cellulositropha]